MKKAIGMFAALILALGMTGVAFAHWSETLWISGTVNTGTFGAALTVEEPYTEGDYKDASSITADLAEGGLSITVTITNAFPCVHYYVPIDLHCTGTVPLHIFDISIVDDLPVCSTVEIIPDIIGPVIEVCTQLHECEIAYGLLHVHLCEDTLPGQIYTFTITIEVVQYNYPFGP